MAMDRHYLTTIDWSNTPLGPMERWSQSLKSYVDMILALPTPAIIFWGPEQTQIYNEGYAAIMGPRHPRYFGAPYRECWPDTYPILAPVMRRVLDGEGYVEIGETSISVTRHGFAEEAYFTFTFSPLRDDDGTIAGIYQPVVETTASVLHDRRAETLRRLPARDDVVAQAIALFATNTLDIPCAAIFSFDDREQQLSLDASHGLDTAGAALAERPQLREAVARAFASNDSVDLELDSPVVAGPWPEPVRTMHVTPLRRGSADAPIGAIAFGVSGRLHFDRKYREFLEGVAREIGTNLASLRAEQAQRDAIAREQSARRDAERTKEEHARRMALLFAHAPVGIAVLRGVDHVFEVANAHYESLLPGQDLIGRPFREVPLAGEGSQELLDRVFETGEPYFGRSIRLALGGGSGGDGERFFDVAYQPAPDEDGKTESIIVIVFEVTELSKARRDAEAASRAKDEFFAVLGHELRNPLAPIATALQLMRLRGDPALEKERTIIERQVDQITRLVDDLLDVSRITRGKVTLERETVEIAEVVTKAIEIASPIFEERRHHLDVDVASRGLVVDGDVARLAQVVSNLLANAAKYSEPGSRVRISAERSSERVVLRVSDSGIGIAPEMLSRVFEPFAQEQQALDRARGGLGLGLTIVDNLVKLHGGAVRAASDGRGRGSTFTVELPASTMAPARSQPRLGAVTLARSPGALRVLVVDDNEDAAEMMSEALAMLGYVVAVAHDGAAALRIVDTVAPDVALLDIGLPAMDGYELAGRLRQGPHGDRVRLVAVTGYGQASDRQRTSEAGFDAHLVKPVQLDVVAELIEKYRTAGPRSAAG